MSFRGRGGRGRGGGGGRGGWRGRGRGGYHQDMGPPETVVGESLRCSESSSICCTRPGSDSSHEIHEFLVDSLSL